ncbi:hypothetical protein HRbin19_01748 [bacterium HR19]|nr:hypothetical protein HRbin19_01748 [bacterium HR19]
MGPPSVSLESREGRAENRVADVSRHATTLPSGDTLKSKTPPSVRTTFVSGTKERVILPTSYILLARTIFGIMCSEKPSRVIRKLYVPKGTFSNKNFPSF